MNILKKSLTLLNFIHISFFKNILGTKLITNDKVKNKLIGNY
jgi:hypothetical protein